MTSINFEAMEDEIDDIVFDVILEHKTRHEAVKELLNLYPVMLSPERIAKQMGWDSYYEMMINEDHIESITKGAINMIFIAYKLKVPFD